MTLVLSGLWTVDAATDPPDVDDGLWPIGAVLVFCGATAAVAYLVDEVTSTRRRRARR